jgi:hypothetical protein
MILAVMIDIQRSAVDRSSALSAPYQDPKLIAKIRSAFYGQRECESNVCFSSLKGHAGDCLTSLTLPVAKMLADKVRASSFQMQHLFAARAALGSQQLVVILFDFLGPASA